ncbi:hypothetical protein OWR29_17720 [Actinoplanes sp. Pm04-4]|uniref:VWFA domain-containing protein n=1 Tax=Paractinoplanes pyxinae TaxID=2997416 RepID=A0ABT4B2K2_9ACTN|nr:VWA domain-containing protein [Actinoplanes pyxinae]MCY1139843.1 hypothetical protein [Actinoplanes pyxinae]
MPAADAAEVQAVDVLFVFDTTGSMGGALNEAKAQVTDAIASVRQKYPDSKFGLATVGDYDPGDTPWALKQKITDDPALLQAAVGPLSADGGGDSPEAYGRALHEAAVNGDIGWRSGAKQILILVNDDVPHDNDLNEGVPEDIRSQASPWNTGIDPGPDGTAGTADDIDWQAALAALKAKGIIFATVFYSGSSVYKPYWDWWTKQAGGSTTTGGGTTSLGDILAELIDDTVSGGSGALDPAAWEAGDVHVHSVGDTSLRDNLYCRNTNPPLIPRNGKATDAQKEACAQHLMRMVVDRMKAPEKKGSITPSPLSWVVLSEHGPWLGINAPGKQGVTDYNTAEGRRQWNIVADKASATAATDRVRMLIGEEMGTTGTTGHFSAYYVPDYVRNGPLNPAEGYYVRDVRRDGGWGAINHPFNGSTWGCWDCLRRYPKTIRAMEIITSEALPGGDLLRRWDQELGNGYPVAAVGGGDTHTVSRVGPPSLHAAEQRGGNTAKLGADGRARTYVYTGRAGLGAGFNSRDQFDPVRVALHDGTSVASNGPLAVMTVDGAAPDSEILPWRPAHQVKVAWNKSDGYGDPTSITVVAGQREDPVSPREFLCTRSPYEAPRSERCRNEKRFAVSSSDKASGQVTIDVDATGFPALARVARPTPHNPSSYIRVQVEFPRVDGKRRVVYTSPVYFSGITA